MEKISAKKIWTSDGWVYNSTVYIKDGVIERIEKEEEALCDVPLLIPGMIELHAHGSLGYDSASANEKGNREWLSRLAMHGVTGILPTLSSKAPEEISSSVAFYSSVMKNGVPGGARVLGVHLEGPFLNMEKKGGMNPIYIANPSKEHFGRLVGENREAVKLITIAPELENADEFIKYATSLGIKVNAGHSLASAEDMRRAVSLGLDGVTHFFNAARPITHRDPSFLTAALLDDTVFCEMVSDLIHLAPETMLLLVRAAGPSRVTVITDTVENSGMPDGEYGNIVVKDRSPRMKDGTLVGGRYLMDDCARALIGIGIDPHDVFRMTSNTPARRLGLTDIGDIAPSYRADLVAMDGEYNCLYTVLGGEKIARAV